MEKIHQHFLEGLDDEPPAPPVKPSETEPFPSFAHLKDKVGRKEGLRAKTTKGDAAQSLNPAHLREQTQDDAKPKKDRFKELPYQF